MMRKHLILASLILACVLCFGCNGSGNGIAPPVAEEQITMERSSAQSDRLILGMYEAVINVETLESEVIPLRTASLTININGFMNQGLNSFTISDIEASNFFTDGTLACNCNLVHPLPGLSQYHIFDTWFVFMSNGNSHLAYDNLTYSGGPDAGQHETVVLNPDGYTRWFNWSEFFPGQWPLVTYNPGALGNLKEPTAMVNPYKIYASGLNTIGDFYDWIKAPINYDDRGVFLADSSVKSRRFYFRFPMIAGLPEVKFQYMIMCSWNEGDPSLTGDPHEYEPWDFPADANVDEPFFVHVDTSASTLFYTGPGDSGGTFKADLEVFDWQGGIVSENGVPNEVYRILVEGDFIPGGSYEFDQSYLTSVASLGTENSSVFSVEIGNCEPQSSDDASLWVIVESDGVNGASYDQGVVAPFPDSRRAAFMTGTVAVGTEIPNEEPIINFIYDDLLGSPDYKSPVDQLDPEIEYAVDFSDTDGGPPTISWWVLPDGETPSGPGTVSDTLPVDWLNDGYDYGDYNIWVQVDDGFNQVQESFPITYEDAFADKILVDNAYTGGNEDGSFQHPYSTINAGIAAGVSTGFDVWVDDSDLLYIDNVEMESDVVVRSMNWDTSDGTNRAVIDPPNVVGTWPVKFEAVSNATLEGFEIRYAGMNNPPYGIEHLRVTGGSDNIIKDCFFTGTTDEYYIYSINALSSSNLTIMNCRFSGIDKDTDPSAGSWIILLAVDNCPGLEILNNVFTDIRSSNDASMKNYWITDISNTTGITLKNNLLHHIITHAPGNSNFGYGFNMSTCNEIEFINNTIDYLDVRDAFFIQQVFAVWFDTCFDVTYTNNLITRIFSNGFPPVLGRGVDAHNGDVVTLYYSDIFNTVVPYMGDVIEGTGYIQIDPDYIDPDNEEYDISATSPAQNGDPSILDWDDGGGGGSRMGCHGGPGGEFVGLLTPQ